MKKATGLLYDNRPFWAAAYIPPCAEAVEYRIPRGFAEDCSLTAVENVRKELSEEEGIGGFQWVCEERFREMIRNGDITDGFTLSAYAQLLCTDKS